VGTIEPYDHLLPVIKTAHATNSLAIDINRRLVNIPMIGGPEGSTDSGRDRDQWKVISGALTYEGKIYVPEDDSLRGKIISLFHDNPESGHFEALKSAELASCDFYAPALDATVRKYIVRCELCHRIKARRHAHHCVNMPFVPPSRAWEGLRMDFVSH